MARTVLDAISDDIREELTTYEAAILDGLPKDFPEYRRVSGVVRGLRIALSKVEDRAKQLDSDDE